MADLRSLDPGFQDTALAFVDVLARARLSPQVTSARRSRSEQTRLYRKYLAGGSPFPAAPPGQSTHELGLAFDLIVEPFEALANAGVYWQQLGGVWGGQAGDPVHFEHPDAQSLLGSLSGVGSDSGGGYSYQGLEKVLSILPPGLQEFARITSLPEQAILRAIAAVPGLDTILSFIGPQSIPLSILQLIASFA